MNRLLISCIVIQGRICRLHSEKYVDGFTIVLHSDRGMFFKANLLFIEIPTSYNLCKLNNGAKIIMT